MPAPKTKRMAKNKKTLSKNTINNNLVNGVNRKVLDDGIGKSKQLAQKIQTKSRSYGRPKTRTLVKEDEVRLCGNGKPMPSLAELEKMFEDSDGDEENKPATPNVTPSTPKKNPKPKLEKKLMSPTTISEIANRMMDLVSNISDPTELLEDRPPPQIIKPKKRRKPDKPYIDGCKDRPYVPERPGVQFCKGDDKYGPDSNEDEDDDLPQKRAKRGKKVNISKSIFNAKSDEIAARLKECDSDGSSDSNKTVAYEYYTPINSGSTRSFSPLPSTSKDNETFAKNDQRFNESLNTENVSKSNLEDDIEILETPCETIEIKDPIPYTTTGTKLDSAVIEIIDEGSPQAFDDPMIASNKAINLNDDDSLQIIDVKPAVNTINIDDDCVPVDIKHSVRRSDSPILVEDFYSNLDIDNIPNDDICEVIDVDDIIAENKAIIEKYSKTSNLDTVTLVDSSQIQATVESNHCDNELDNHCKDRVNVTKGAQSNVNSDDSVANEQPSIIIVNNEESIPRRPILVENELAHADVELVDNSNSPILCNGARNRRTVESVLIDLESSLANNRNRNNNSFAPGFNFVEEIRQTNHQPNYPTSNCPPRYSNHPSGCHNQQSSSAANSYGSNPNNDSYRKQLKILQKFFKKNQRTSQRRKTLSKTLPNENIFSEPFMSWLQSIYTGPRGSINEEMSSRISAQSPALTPPTTMTTSTNSPDKTGKRIGDCPICMDSLSNKPIVSTICGHVFCMECIKLSIKSNGNKCPTCRKALKKGTGYHQIFL